MLQRWEGGFPLPPKKQNAKKEKKFGKARSPESVQQRGTVVVGAAGSKFMRSAESFFFFQYFSLSARIYGYVVCAGFF